MRELTLQHLHAKGATHIGYGRLGVKLHAALEARGFRVYNAITDSRHEEHMSPGADPGRSNVVCWVSTPSHARGWLRDQHTAIFTMWEATHLPEAFRTTLHEFDTVLVPSDHNIELFSNYHDNVHLVPLGVDPAEWSFVERQDPTSEFRFLCGGSGTRKGVDVAIEAFKKVFGDWAGDGPEPKLILKSPKGAADDATKLGADHARIEIIPGRLSDEEEQALYAYCHVYVQPSRGEGFGLQPIQAMAQGMPTILTEGHGHAAFARHGLTVSTSLAPSAYFIFGDAGMWWEPNLDEVCDQMRWCYDNWTQAKQVGMDAAFAVARDFTWDRTAAAFVDAFPADAFGPYRGEDVWVEAQERLYPVVLIKPWTADIAGYLHMFEAGKEYRETADVKRVLFESGMLDPVCLEATTPDGECFENGLLPEQVAQIGAYQARHAFCHACGQQLGTGVSRADVILAEKEAAL